MFVMGVQIVVSVAMLLLGIASWQEAAMQHALSPANIFKVRGYCLVALFFWLAGVEVLLT